MCKAERCARETARESCRKLQLRSRLIESAECLERAGKAGMRSVEPRIELDRHATMKNGFLVIAREVVGVASSGSHEHRQRIERHRFFSGRERFFVSLERIQSAAE